MALRCRSAAIVLVVTCSGLLGAASSEAAGDPSRLFGGSYLSTSVIKDGSPHQLVEGTRIRVWFRHEAPRDIVRWRAGCNYFGARVEITVDQLLIKRPDQTLIGCSEPALRQDRWVAAFFRSDPRWELHGRALTLTSGDDVIELRRSC